MKMESNIATTCNVPSKFIDIKGSKMHYLEMGEGDPILFLHGVPTSSYVWRNIIPLLSNVARCIAPDLIGMGASDKPDIDYSIFNHIEYVDELIEKLELRNVTLVMHAWGSVVGFDYAKRHESNVKGLAFYEAHIRAATDWNMLSLPVQQLASLLQRPGASYRAVVQQNYLVNKLLPRGVVRPLTDVEMAEYRKPYPTPESRKPLWQYIQDLPLGEGPEEVVKLIANYSEWLQQTTLPKLMLYAVPGFNTTMETVQWAKDHLSNLQLVGLDDVLHFAQESIPELFADTLRDWYPNLTKELHAHA